MFLCDCVNKYVALILLSILNIIDYFKGFLYNDIITDCNVIIGLKDFRFGTIDMLYDIFSEDKLLKYWDMSRREIAQCKDCGLRYACNDCRSLEIRLGAKIDEKITCMR